jgi:hypothetical protein
LEYYGGFEYCDKAMVQTVGNWTFYQGDRVDDCCDRFEGREKVEYMDEEE